ncbi:flagellin lysine-N-methylase [Porcipelethomonas sp.]|uniref:flagellin lysine-N-methylase n=1 Tax=Porcipelethomonas sp. TaxID=2981675 RepID=UPI003EF81268
MFVTVPDYYNKFKCIADKCPDNCCIGWEIDIDDKSYEKYNNTTDDMGELLRNNIVLSDDGCFSFKLADNERCPFLNKKNLCILITEKGKDFLCEICREHPRFHNCFGNIRETGIGMGCISAAEIIISQKNKTGYITIQNNESEYEIDYDENFLNQLKNIRKEIFKILQNRNMNMNERLAEMLLFGEKIQAEIDGERDFETSEIILQQPDYDDYKILLEKLIPLNEYWKRVVKNMKLKDILEINNIEYEQIAVYFIYRHFLSAVYDRDIISRIKLTIIYCLTILCISDNSYSITQKACLVSKEIEYCSENIDLLLDFSYTEKCMSTECLLGLLKKY